MATTDAKDIKMNIVHVLLVCSNLAIGTYMFARKDTKIDSQMGIVSDAVTRIESNQKQESAENKIWRGKVEAELADLRIRTALLEARVFTSLKR